MILLCFSGSFQVCTFQKPIQSYVFVIVCICFFIIVEYMIFYRPTMLRLTLPSPCNVPYYAYSIYAT